MVLPGGCGNEILAPQQVAGVYSQVAFVQPQLGRLIVAGLLRGSLAARRSRRISLRWGWFGSAAGRATASVAARQVRKRHLIQVIRDTGAPSARSTTDRRSCADCGPLLPSP